MDLPVDHLAAWALAMDQGERFREVPAGVRFLGREGSQLGVELTRDLEDDAEAELFAGERVYAIAGGAPLVQWLLRPLAGGPDDRGPARGRCRQAAAVGILLFWTRANHCRNARCNR